MSGVGGAYTAYLAFQNVSVDAADTGADGISSGVFDGGSNDSLDGLDTWDFPPTTLACLQRYGTSENVSERQVAVRHILKTLQSVANDAASTETVFRLIADGFAHDNDPLIRAELLEQLPLLFMHCMETAALQKHIGDILVPLLAKFLSDANTQVRKTCQAAILILLEQELLTQGLLEGNICPALLDLATSPQGSVDEIRLEAVSLLCKIITSSPVDRKWAIDLFLGKFTTFCSDSVFHIRKVCASSLGEISKLFGRELTEKVLVPHLIQLSQDAVWGVRKACAECYTEVSNNCSMATRRCLLAPTFIVLLADPSRWVTSQAFQSLGPFIATFADSNRTGLQWMQGKLCYVEPASASSCGEDTPAGGVCVPPDVYVPAISPSLPKGNPDDDSMAELSGLLEDLDVVVGANKDALDASKSSQPQAPKLELKSSDDEDAAAVDDDSAPVEHAADADDGAGRSIADEDFGAVNYWRLSLTNLNEAVDAEEASAPPPTDAAPQTPTDDPSYRAFMDRHFADAKPIAPPPLATRVARTPARVHDAFDTTTTLPSDSESDDDSPIVILMRRDRGSHRTSERDSEAERASNGPDCDFEYQDIIPQALLDNFLSMVEPQRAAQIESDICRHCAYNLPAVAYTLGRRYWPQIKPTYVTLANDMQWKVRRTLSFSIHELAAIVGHDITVHDLLPIFQSFLRDLDEVRIGVLKHLTDFIALLNPDVRRLLLGNLADFMQTDNTKNWRFRYEFTKQCIQLCDLYDTTDINQYIAAIGLTLATDKIADIRREAANLLSTILSRFFHTERQRGDSDMRATLSFIADITKGFAQSQRWLRRQTFAYVCERVVVKRALDEANFEQRLLPHLLRLSEDQIPNVRLAFIRAARVLVDGSTDAPDDAPHFRPSARALEALHDAFNRLAADTDRDCRQMSLAALGCDDDVIDVSPRRSLAPASPPAAAADEQQ